MSQYEVYEWFNKLEQKNIWFLSQEINKCMNSEGIIGSIGTTQKGLRGLVRSGLVERKSFGVRNTPLYRLKQKKKRNKFVFWRKKKP